MRLIDDPAINPVCGARVGHEGVPHILGGLVTVVNGDSAQREFDVVDFILHRNGLILQIEQFNHTEGVAIFVGWLR